MTNKIVNLANNVSQDQDRDFILLNAAISRATERRLSDVLKQRKQKRSKAGLIICTEGGDPDAAFRIGRCLQESYQEHDAVVAGWCKSAGTLICIAATNIVMGPRGELGPLDIQLAKPDDLGGSSSGLTLDSAFRSLKSIGFDIFEHFMLEMIRKSQGRITTRTASEISAKITSGILAPIFEQIDPVKVGEDYRSTRIAEEYAERLNYRARNLIVKRDFDAMEALVRGYPSHGFVIDKTEAAVLFQRVQALAGDLDKIIEELGKLAVQPQSSLRDEAELVTYLNDEGNGNAHPASARSAQPPPDSGVGGGQGRGAQGHVPAHTHESIGDVAVSPKRRRSRQKARSTKR